MNKYKNKIAITTGDPNGIGPEVTIKALNLLNISSDDVVLISNRKVLNSYGKLLNNYELIEVDYSERIASGSVMASAGDFAYRCLEKACSLKPKFLVTAPTSKEAMNMAGYKYAGQTEVLEKLLAHDEQKAEMLFVSKDFRVLLLTRHIALSEVSKEISSDLIISKVERLQKFFQNQLNIQKPKFALCALNPHAGEHGLMGNEEENVMLSAVKTMRYSGIDITNTLPADTLFIKGVQNYLSAEKIPYDCYIACYHDQGLIPIKSVASDKTVNMTIGLDVIRTSPCHGTAFDIAGKNVANPKSMIEAIKYCLY